jgi:macrodomain Ter protein organizer (MatP/YcbG family)
MAKSIRLQTNVRPPLGSEVKRLAQKEGRTDSEMVEQLLEEAVRERATKGLAEHV